MNGAVRLGQCPDGDFTAVVGASDAGAELLRVGVDSASMVDVRVSDVLSGLNDIAALQRGICADEARLNIEGSRMDLAEGLSVRFGVVHNCVRDLLAARQC